MTEPTTKDIIQKHKDGDALSMTEVQHLIRRLEEAEATVKKVRELPIKWLSECVGTGITPKDGDAKTFCAYELQALIKGEGDV